MKAKIIGWFSGEVVEEEIIDLQAWIEMHDGAVIVQPPSITRSKMWVIYTASKTNRFNQR